MRNPERSTPSVGGGFFFGWFVHVGGVHIVFVNGFFVVVLFY